jgi:hypothetical protein
MAKFGIQRIAGPSPEVVNPRRRDEQKSPAQTGGDARAVHPFDQNIQKLVTFW